MADADELENDLLFVLELIIIGVLTFIDAVWNSIQDYYFFNSV